MPLSSSATVTESITDSAADAYAALPQSPQLRHSCAETETETGVEGCTSAAVSQALPKHEGRAWTCDAVSTMGEMEFCSRLKQWFTSMPEGQAFGANKQAVQHAVLDASKGLKIPSRHRVITFVPGNLRI